jgi:hypothetical protein
VEKINIDHTFQDKSKYLKGLLLLTKKDFNVSHQETEIIKRAGKRLGFAEDFYEDAIRNLLGNPNINEEPLQFSNEEIAVEFLKDGLELAYCDTSSPIKELELLRRIADTNGIERDRFYRLSSEYPYKNKI